MTEKDPIVLEIPRRRSIWRLEVAVAIRAFGEELEYQGRRLQELGSRWARRELDKIQDAASEELEIELFGEPQTGSARVVHSAMCQNDGCWRVGTHRRTLECFMGPGVA